MDCSEWFVGINNVIAVCFNSLRPNDAYIRHKIQQSLVQIMTCRLFVAEPFSEPALNY